MVVKAPLVPTASPRLKVTVFGARITTPFQFGLGGEGEQACCLFVFSCTSLNILSLISTILSFLNCGCVVFFESGCVFSQPKDAITRTMVYKDNLRIIIFLDIMFF
jgi:hypothetical protein